MAESTPPRGGSKLESLAKEDLIKFAKKQTILLSKSKEKCEDLTKQVHKFQKETDGLSELESQNKKLLDELSECQQEIEKSVLKIKDVERENEAAQIEKKNLIEQMECMTLKEDTMTTTFQCLKDDLNKSIQENKVSQDQLLVMTTARDEVLQTLKALKQTEGGIDELKIALDEVQSEKKAIKIQLQHYKDTVEKQENTISTYQKEKETLSASIVNATAEKDSLTNDIKKQKENFEKLKAKALKIKQERDNFTKDIETFQKSNSDLKNQVFELEKVLKLIEEEKNVHQNEKIELENALRQKEEILASAQEENVKMTKENAIALESIEKYRLNLEKIEAEIESMKAQQSNSEPVRNDCEPTSETFENSNMELTQSLIEHKETCQTLTHEKEKLQHELQDLAEKYSNCQSEKEKQIEGLSDDSRSLRDEIGQFKLKIEEQAACLRDTEMRCQELTSEIEKLRVNNEVLLNESDGKAATDENNEDERVSEIKGDRDKIVKVLNVLKDELEKQKNENASLLEQENSLKEEISQLREEKEMLNFEVINAQEKLADWENLIHLLRDDKDKLQADVSAAEDKEKRCKYEVEDVMGSLQDALGERDSLRNEVCEMDSMRKMMEELLTEKRNMQKEMDEMVDINNEYEIQINDQHSKIEDLEKELSEKTKEIQAMAITVNEMKSKATEHTQTEEETIEHLSKKIDDLTEAIRVNADEKAALQEEINNFSETVREQLSEIEVLSEETTKLRTSNHDLDTECESIRNQLKTTEEERSHLFNTNNELNTSISSLERANSELQQQLNLLQSASCDLKVIEGEKSELSEMISSVKEELAEAQTQLEEFQDRAPLQSKQMKELELENERLNKALATADNDRARLDKEMCDIRDALKKSMEEGSELSDKTNSLLNENQTLNSSIGEYIEQLEKNKTEKDKLHIELQRKNDELEGLMADLAKDRSGHQQNISRTEDQLTTLSTEKDELRSQLHDIQTKYQSLLKDNAEIQTKAEDQVTVKEWEEKANKFKMLAIKSKKEMAEGKNMIQSLEAEVKNLDEKNLKLEESIRLADQVSRSNLDSLQALQEEYEKLHDMFDAEKDKCVQYEQEVLEIAQVKKELADVKEESCKMKIEFEDVIKQKTTQQLQNDQLQTHFNTVLAEKESGKKEKDEMNKGMQQARDRVDELEESLRRKQEEHLTTLRDLENKIQDLKQELQFTQKEAKQSSMMDLEIADYERTVMTLNEQINSRDAKVQELELEISRLVERTDSLQKQIESIESQRLQADERGNKMKQLLVKTKKDLTDAKKLELDSKNSDAVMKSQLEQLSQQAEEYKIQLADVMGGCQRLKDELQSTRDSQHRKVKSMESTVQTLQGDLELAKSELTSTQAEYDGYKIRVHSVLKQQRSKPVVNTEYEEEKHERGRMEKTIEQLKSKLQDTHANLDASICENQLLQEEHDRLMQRHNKVVHDIQEKEVVWRNRVDKLSTESTQSRSEHLETVRQLTSQNELLSNNFKLQIKTLVEDHNHSLHLLQKQLDTADGDIARLQREIQQYQHGLSRERVDTPVAEFVRDPRQEERPQIEGMENPELEPSHKKVISSPTQKSIISFDQLLNSPLVEDKVSEISDNTVDEETLKMHLTIAEKRIEHLTQLLNESEATVMHMTEQARVLKEEIRRLERNQERETSISNMEYLKNVVLKFLSLQPGDERECLIPVMTTMLKFSTDEKKMLTAIAKGEGATYNSTEAAGWTSYLQRLSYF